MPGMAMGRLAPVSVDSIPESIADAALHDFKQVAAAALPQRGLHPKLLDTQGTLGQMSLHLTTALLGELVVGVGTEERDRVLVTHARLTCSCGIVVAADGARSDRLSFIRISAASSLRPR